MHKSVIRRIAIIFFVVYALAVTWPMATLARAADPRVLGMPLSLAWPTAWIVLGWAVLLVLDYFENRDH